ncbi:hypothetical protein [Fodinicola acaciae]|uniref:TPR repeat region-containing protein n=1 Tax=Fodinicola acaciae TaxID=2681555 RepID=UPI0013D6D32C|nr:hypothetical protein [Fodinicola acaciae]
MVAAPEIPDTAAQPGVIQASATRLAKVAAAITGHGEDVHAALGTAALGFSDLVADNIKALAGYNEAAWQAAYQGLFWGSATTHRWAGNVVEFKAKRAKLLAAWHQAEGTHFGVTQPDIPAGATAEEKKQAVDAYAGQVDAAGSKLSADLTSQGQALLTELHNNADARAGELQREPTDADLNGLAQAGLLSWGGYLAYQGRGLTAPPITAADAKALADQVEAAAQRGDTEAVKKGLAIIGDLADAIIAGNGPRDGIEALNAFYGALGLTGLTTVKNFLDQHPNDFAASTVEALGRGLLVLSNEQYADGDGTTGGLSQLPKDIQDLVKNEPPTTLNPNEISDYLAKWRTLASVLGYTAENVQGGREFSALITFRVSQLAARIDLLPGDPHILHFDDSLESLISVSTRNHLANYDVLTSEYGQQALAKILDYDWLDDGKAASGLITWIATDGQLPATPENAELRAHATAAAANVINWLTDPHNEHFRDSYIAIHDSPQFAFAVADVAGAYLGDFAEPSADETGVSRADGSLGISDGDRQRFLALVASNPDALAALSVKVGAYEQDQLNKADAGLIDYRQAATVNAALDGNLGAAAQNADDIDRQLSYEVDSQRYKETLSNIALGRTLATTAGGFIPGVGSLVNASINVIANAISDGVIPPSPPVEGNAPELVDQGFAETKGYVDYGNAAIASDPAAAAQIRAQIAQTIAEHGYHYKVEDFFNPDGSLKSPEAFASSEASEVVTEAVGAAYPGAGDYAADYRDRVSDSYDTNKDPSGKRLLDG